MPNEHTSGAEVTLRQKLLLMFSATVAVAVAAVGWTVSVRVRQVFDQLDREQMNVFAQQFQREFQHRANDVALAVDRIAASEPLTRMSFELAHGGDAAQYLVDAGPLAQEYRLNYLEIVGSDGNIISSAQWPARFGYSEPSISAAGRPPFLKQEELPEGPTETGLFVVRAIHEPESDSPSLYIVGGVKLDHEFLAALPVPAQARVYLYHNAQSIFDPQYLTGKNGDTPTAVRFQPLIDAARTTGDDASGIVYLTSHREDSVNATAIPLKSAEGKVLAVLLIATSRRGMVETQQHVRATALGVAGLGIISAIAGSLWIAARISRPIEQLARAAGDVADGLWDTRVPIQTRDEVGALATSFNRMTSQLAEQRDRLIQSERVAAWRELARRLAHELKNPLFPLQLTVENIIRARELPPDEFEEVFAEGTATLKSEVANLKTIIGRFSDFSRMPAPQEEIIDARNVLQRVVALYAPVLRDHKPPIMQVTELPEQLLRISADPELMHRAISNLVLNAVDAMPNGGELRASASRKDSIVQIRICDTGQGLTPEECARLFTPYYTTREYGTGLGLAVVQSVVSDHRGTVRVESSPGTGTAFIIELPAVEEVKS
jgi:signal transduction histidine kinase